MRRQARAAAWAVASIRQPCRHFKSHCQLKRCRRSDLGGREPVPVLQADQVVRAARGRLQRGARRSGGPAAGRHHLAHRARAQRSRLQGSSTPDRCAATAGKRYQQSRLGWAAQTVGETCYDSNGRPRRYSAVCERKYSWGTAKEDYVLPEAHTVAIRIAPEQLAGVDRRLHLELAAAQGRRQGREQEDRLQGQADHRARAVRARSRAAPALRSRSSCRTAASSPSRTSWSRTSSSWRSAIPLPRAKAIPTGRCSSAPSREMVYDPA